MLPGRVENVSVALDVSRLCFRFCLGNLCVCMSSSQVRRPLPTAIEEGHCFLVLPEACWSPCFETCCVHIQLVRQGVERRASRCRSKLPVEHHCGVSRLSNDANSLRLDRPDAPQTRNSQYRRYTLTRLHTHQATTAVIAASARASAPPGTPAGTISTAGTPALTLALRASMATSKHTPRRVLV